MPVFFSQNGLEVGFQHVLIDDMNIFIMFQCMVEDALQALIQLEGRHIRAGLCERLRQSADTGSDLHDGRPLAELCSLCDGSNDIGADEKVLPQAVLRVDTEAVHHILDDFTIC